MKITCKSEIAIELIKQINNRLSKVEINDYKGINMEESGEIYNHIDQLKNITVYDNNGDCHKPISTNLASHLVHDEIEKKREELDIKSCNT